MKRILIIALTIGAAFSSAKAEIYNLDLEKSIAIAKEKSLTMLRLKQDVKISEFELKEVTSQLKTHIDLDFTVPSYSDKINKYTDTSGVHFTYNNNLNYNGSLTINQPLPTDGRIYIESNVDNTSDFIRKNESSALSTTLNLRQPLTSLYGYNSIRSRFKIAMLNYNLTSKQMKREELNLIYNVSNSFFNLLSQKKTEEIAQLNLERQKEAYTIAKNKYEAGLIKEVEALQMEVDLAEAQNSYDISVINKSEALNQLKELIGIDLNDSIIISSKMDYKPVIVNPEKAVELALQNRLEIKELDIQIELNKLSIKENKSNGMVKADLNAMIGLNGSSEQPIEQSFRNSMTQSYNNLIRGRNSYGVGLTVSVPILDWGQNRARVNTAKARLQQNIYRQEENKRSIESEVRNLAVELNSSLKRLQLLEKNVEVAEKSFGITRQRFTDGNIDSQALALERERLNNAYNTHLRAYINYQLLLADIMRKTFYDFQRDTTIN